MIKWKGTRGTQEVIGFGLSAGNVKQLRKGRPIYVHGVDLGLAFDVVIMAGDTEQAILDEFEREGAIDEHTILHMSRPKRQ